MAGVVLLSVTALAACGNDGGTVAATPSATPAPIGSPPPCPSPTTRAITWPKEVPADMPKPPGAVLEKAEYTPNGIYTVRFTTPQSLNESVLFVVRSMPKTGFVIGRGDAESFEADAPFERGELRGLIKMLAGAPCRTLWLLAFASANRFRNGAPFAPNYSPPASSSPLPFG